MVEYKHCAGCNSDKATTDFSKHSKRSDGLQSYCKICCSALHSKYYNDPSTQRKEKIQQRNINKRLKRQAELFEYLSSHACVDCGETDILVLEFDHVAGKNYNISEMTTYAWSTVLKEISLCEVRCANCHARATYKRAGTPRFMYATLEA